MLLILFIYHSAALNGCFHSERRDFDTWTNEGQAKVAQMRLTNLIIHA